MKPVDGRFLHVASEPVEELQHVAERLGFPHRVTCHMGARALGLAILALRKSFDVMSLAPAVLAGTAGAGGSDILRVLLETL